MSVRSGTAPFAQTGSGAASFDWQLCYGDTCETRQADLSNVCGAGTTPVDCDGSGEYTLSSAGWYCTNNRSVDFTLRLPFRRSQAQIDGATLDASFGSRSGETYNHTTNLSFNGTPLGGGVVPAQASLSFPVPPTLLDEWTQVVQLDSYHPYDNTAHYSWTSDLTLRVDVSNLVRRECRAPGQGGGMCQTNNWFIGFLDTQYDLEVTKSVVDANGNPGPFITNPNTLTFQVTVTNNGTMEATNIVLQETLPVNYSVSLVSPSVGTYDETTHTWTIPTLSSNQGQNEATLTVEMSLDLTTIEVPGRVNRLAENLLGVPQANTASLPTPDLDPANDTATSDFMLVTCTHELAAGNSLNLYNSTTDAINGTNAETLGGFSEALTLGIVGQYMQDQDTLVNRVAFIRPDMTDIELFWVRQEDLPYPCGTVNALDQNGKFIPPPSITLEVQSVNGTPYPQFGEIIPYYDNVTVDIAFTNNTGVDINEWSLELFGIESPQSPSYEVQLPLELGSSSDSAGGGLYSDTEKRIRWSASVQQDQTITYSPILGARRSGIITTGYRLTSVTNGIAIIEEGQLEIMTVASTRLPFANDGLTDEEEIIYNGMRAAIFWAIYNETSEGRYAEHNPNNLDCFRDGWDTGETGQQITGVIHESDPDQDFCRGLIYNDVQAMINGILNSERDIALGGDEVYQYFTGNYRGSLGNKPTEESGLQFKVPISAPLATENGSNAMWVIPECWPGGLEGTSYREALETGDQQTIFVWLDHFTNCRAEQWEVAPNDDEYSTHLFAFYNTLMSSDGYITQGFNDFLQGVPDSTQGAVERKGINYDDNGETVVYEEEVANCTGDSEQFLFDTLDFSTPFEHHMNEIGDPEFGHSPPPNYQGYIPANDSILQPVVWLKRVRIVNPEAVTFDIASCSWTTTVYQRTESPFHYPR
jgi:uncharacterized repeat protein (TIGR01451 family)